MHAYEVDYTMKICLVSYIPHRFCSHTQMTDRTFRLYRFTFRQLSKRLTYALRHGSEKLGLNLRPDGFASLDELLSKPSFRGVTRQQVQQVVSTDGSAPPLVYRTFGGERRSHMAPNRPLAALPLLLNRNHDRLTPPPPRPPPEAPPTFSCHCFFFSGSSLSISKKPRSLVEIISSRGGCSGGDGEVEAACCSSVNSAIRLDQFSFFNQQ